MFIHKSVFIITSEGDIFKGKGFLHRMKGSFSAFKKRKTNGEKKLKTHTGALPILLVHSNTGWKEKESY